MNKQARFLHRRFSLAETYITRALLALLFALAIFSSQAADAAVRHSIGIARDASDNSIRYIEHHQYLEDGSHSVKYYDTDNSVMLTKELSYPGLPQHPTIFQSDYLSNMRTSIERRQHVVTITRESVSGSDSFSFPLTENTVVDAGFDGYIKTNFTTLERNAKRQFDFAVAGQKRLLKMNLRYMGRENDLARFDIEPANWVIKLLIPRITLFYNDERQLVRYKGFSNLKPRPGDSREVKIEFEHYESEELLEGPLQQWIADSRS